MPSTNVLNELFVKISLLRSIPKKIIAVCNAVYFRLCIDLMHILPPVTAEGFDVSHHPRFAEWFFLVYYKSERNTSLSTVAIIINVLLQELVLLFLDPDEYLHGGMHYVQIFHSLRSEKCLRKK